jgi:replicative DNA helicase
MESLKNDWELEREARLRYAEKRFNFGIEYLDETLGGISPIDLIVVGAGTGIGKTEIAAIIARNAARQGKRVLFYALEASAMEIHSRMRYQAMAEFFFANRSEFPSSLHLNYFEWYLGRAKSPELELLEHLAAEKIQDEMQFINVVTPRLSEFTAEEVVTLTKEWGHANLVILDHLHYLSFDQNEYMGMKDAVAEIRDFVNTEEVPVVALSHLRKAERKDAAVVPTIEELHGSSEISKRANSVITFARAHQATTLRGDEIEPPAGATFCRVNKARIGAEGATRYAAMLQFDLQTHSYKPRYFPFEVNRWATEAKALPLEKMPYWMRSAKEFA